MPWTSFGGLVDKRGLGFFELEIDLKDDMIFIQVCFQFFLVLFNSFTVSFPNLFLGKWLGSRQIRCNWATKGAGTNDDKQSSDSRSVVELTNGSSG